MPGGMQSRDLSVLSPTTRACVPTRDFPSNANRFNHPIVLARTGCGHVRGRNRWDRRGQRGNGAVQRRRVAAAGAARRAARRHNSTATTVAVMTTRCHRNQSQHQRQQPRSNAHREGLLSSWEVRPHGVARHRPGGQGDARSMRNAKCTSGASAADAADLPILH